MNDNVKKATKIIASLGGFIVAALGIEKSIEANRRKKEMDDSINRANRRKEYQNDSESM